MHGMDMNEEYEDGEEYDVQFSAEVIEQIHAKFMLNLQNKDIFNLEHDQDEKVPAYILEAWIVDSPETDKAFTTCLAQIVWDKSFEKSALPITKTACYYDCQNVHIVFGTNRLKSQRCP